MAAYPKIAVRQPSSPTSAPPSGAPTTEAIADVAPSTPMVRPRNSGGAVIATAMSTLTKAKR
jgi:hypothetical protein